jgi:hypothetical protein
MPGQVYNRMAVVGFGLIGSSLARIAREKGVVGEFVAAFHAALMRAPESARKATVGQHCAMLRGKVGRLEERMAVLERIATDAPARLTAEIDKLRD